MNGPYGLSSKPTMLLWNLSSGACAINLAFHFGVAKIVLLGYDMRRIDGEGHWHRDYVPRGGKLPTEPYKRFLKAFPSISNDLRTAGVEIVNASPGSAIDCIPIVDPEDVLPSPAS